MEILFEEHKCLKLVKGEQTFQESENDAAKEGWRASDRKGRLLLLIKIDANQMRNIRSYNRRLFLSNSLRMPDGQADVGVCPCSKVDVMVLFRLSWRACVLPWRSLCHVIA